MKKNKFSCYFQETCNNVNKKTNIKLLALPVMKEFKILEAVYYPKYLITGRII